MDTAQFSMPSKQLICFCGPTASGKSTICSRLCADDDSLWLSVSSTTRAPRKGEVDGVHYYFTPREEFERRVKDEKFIEYAEYGSNLYGTETRVVDAALNEQRILLLDIEVQGVSQLKRLYPNKVATIFVIPPSLEELLRRLRGRGTETEDVIQQRLKIAQSEIEQLCAPKFSDYVLINDDLDIAISKARGVIDCECLRVSEAKREAVLQQFRV